MVRCALLLCELPRSVREIESTAIKYSTSVLLCQMGLETDGLEDENSVSALVKANGLIYRSH
jgi:hypothetical protein